MPQASLIDIGKFVEFARNQGFVGDKVLKQIGIAINTAVASGTTPALLLRGPAGSGKTWVSELLARYLDAKYVFIQATPGMSEDELLYKYVPSERSTSGVEIVEGPLPEALKISQKSRVVLVIDEFDKTRPSADALLLDYLQNARISLRINNKKKLVVGRKENLVVILTSNDFREFSEPLLRRVVSIFFEPPPPESVKELLRRKFDDERIVELLSMIYTAGQYARLSKPITIQELYQLGMAMKLYPNAKIEELLLMFITKNYDDLYELQRALEQLRADEFTSSNNSNDVNIAETLIKKINEVNENVQQNPSNQTNSNSNSTTTVTVQQILSMIKVTRPVIDELKPEVVDQDRQIETFTAIEDNDFIEYTRLIQALDPEPSDNPAEFDKFKVVYDEVQKKLVVTAIKPLYILELANLYRTDMNAEFYASDIIAYDNDDNNPLKTLAKRLGSSLYHLYRIFYYTKNTIIFGVNSDITNDRAVIVRMQRLVNDDNIFKIDIYINTKVMSKNLRMSVRDFVDYELKYLRITAYIDKAIEKIQQVSVYKDANEFIMKKDEIPYLKSAVEILRRFSKLITVKIERAENACETARDYRRNKELVRGRLNAEWNRDDMVFTIYLPPCVPDIKALEDLLVLPVVDF